MPASTAYQYRTRLGAIVVCRALLFLPALSILSSCSFMPDVFVGVGSFPSFGSEATGSSAGRRADHGQLKSGAENGPEMLPEPSLALNREVEKEMENFSAENHHFFASALDRREKLYGTMRRILLDQGVPETFLNLALIESGFRVDARSRAGAVGLWQFMAPTAKLYGLRITKKEDQRKDPILSTIAAAKLLRDLYSNYGDWHLALAAYNAGVGTIDRAILRSRSNDYWEIVRKGHLRRETAQFVPRFIAASLMINKLYGKQDQISYAETNGNLNERNQIAASNWAGYGYSPARPWPQVSPWRS